MKKNVMLFGTKLTRNELRFMKGGLTDGGGNGGGEIGDGDDDYGTKCAARGQACGSKKSCCSGNYCVGNSCWPSNP
ncbi:hypothetical protein [Chryseobacterium sp. ERMR1:04]|uniref:hypothetical protein n=1 Tax=Chryseobacterium sp. ERMR1:04 TaxID=1705393 RepID=UPI0006C8CA15|nr:hypothetical protein [Chryseobacterium sp. ERMR1:04]KPH13324.1 hypothetical protein AMQ68_12770 [Chryseobacterium sp. ERMR1:04]